MDEIQRPRHGDVRERGAAPATTATFDQAGTYVLRLTASDSLLTRVQRRDDHGEPGGGHADEPGAEVSAGRRDDHAAGGRVAERVVTDDGLPTGAR